MKVSNMTSDKGNMIPNQFIIEQVPAMKSLDDVPMKIGDQFQSYKSVICHKAYDGTVYLDRGTWDCSVTTGKYRNMFLGETKKETQEKIYSGEYILTDLN
jgi:hypothetical protein